MTYRTSLAATAREVPDGDEPFTALPERNLDRRELQALVEQLASRPDLWREQVAFSDTERHYASLHRDEFVDVWLLCWTRQNDTGWHDHDLSSGAVARGPGHADRVQPPDRRRAPGHRGRRGLLLLLRPGSHPPADRREWTMRSPCTPTRRRCGGWASTTSPRTGSCAGSRSRTRTSCGRPTGRPRPDRPVRPGGPPPAVGPPGRTRSVTTNHPPPIDLPFIAIDPA